MLSSHRCGAVVVGVLIIAIVVSHTAASSHATLDPACVDIVLNFSACVGPLVRNGTCGEDNNTGQLSLCLPCLQYYGGFIACQCQSMVEAYGIASCSALCGDFWMCSEMDAQLGHSCLPQLDALTQCVNAELASQRPATPVVAVPQAPRPLVPKVTTEVIMPHPAFAYCHACTLTELADGTIFAVFDMGPAERDPTLGIWGAWRSPNGTWSEVVEIVQTGVCNENPSLYQGPDGTLYLMFHYGGLNSVNGSCDTDSWNGAVMNSTDGGKTWSKYRQLPSSPLFTYVGGVKNKCVFEPVTKSVLCPGSTEGIVYGAIEYWRSHIELTDPTFQEWNHSNLIYYNMWIQNNSVQSWCPFYGTIQPSLLVSPAHDCEVLALLRTGCGIIAQSRSHDCGRTFDSPAYPTVAKNNGTAGYAPFPNPNAGIDSTVMLGEPEIGYILLFNDSPDNRNPLTLATSLDGGYTWERVLVLHYSADNQGSYQYPAVVQSKLNPKVAHSCYTYIEPPAARTMAYSRLDWSQ